MTYYGRHSTDFESDYGTIIANELRLCVFNRSSANRWVRRIGFYGGRHGSTSPKARGVLYDTTSGMNPDDLLAYTNEITVSVAASFPNGGNDYEGDLAWVHDGNTLGVQIWSGQRYAVGIHNKVATLGHSMKQAAYISADNEKFYYRFGLSSPPNPVGSYSSSTEGHMTVWLLYDTNYAPQTPSSNLAPSGVITTITPTITADFQDRNGLWGETNGGNDVGDKLTYYQIQVVRVSDNVVMWDSGSVAANSTEQSNNAVSKVYGGSALTRGVEYKFRIRVADRFNTWSSFSEYVNFTPTALGAVTLGGDPLGKIEETTPDFQGVWTHEDALDTNRVQVQILNTLGAVLQTGAEVTKTVNDTDQFTITWAESGLTEFAWGQSLQFRIRGRDTNNVWSDYSPLQSFNTNAAPDIPGTPTSSLGNLVTSYPLIRVAATDDDDEAVGIDPMLVKLRIKDDVGAVLFTRSMAWNDTLSLWEYQITSTDFATFDTYRLDAYSGDGTLWSGEVAWGSEASAVKSAELVIVYAEGPAVTMDEPDDLDTITTSSLTVQWTVSSQAKYQIKVALAGDSTFIYDSGEVVDTDDREHSIPAGYIRNGNDYDIYLLVTNSAPLTTTTVHTITASFTPPDSVEGFQAIAVRVGNDPFETSILLQWDQTLEPLSTFVRYEIWRELAGVAIKRANITSPFQLSYIDYEPVSGADYQWQIVQVTLDGLDTLTSEPVTVAESVSLRGAVLVSVEEPEEYRSVLHIASARRFSRKDQSARFVPPAGPLDEVTGLRMAAKPITIRAASRWFEWSIVASLITFDGITGTQRLNELLDLDEHGGIFSYRDDRGRIIYGTIDGIEITDKGVGNYEVNVTMIEETYIETPVT